MIPGVMPDWRRSPTRRRSSASPRCAAPAIPDTVARELEDRKEDPEAVMESASPTPRCSRTPVAITATTQGSLSDTRSPSGARAAVNVVLMASGRLVECPLASARLPWCSISSPSGAGLRADRGGGRAGDREVDGARAGGRVGERGLTERLPCGRYRLGWRTVGLARTMLATNGYRDVVMPTARRLAVTSVRRCT